MSYLVPLYVDAILAVATLSRRQEHNSLIKSELDPNLMPFKSVPFFSCPYTETNELLTDRRGVFFYACRAARNGVSCHTTGCMVIQGGIRSNERAECPAALM